MEPQVERYAKLGDFLSTHDPGDREEIPFSKRMVPRFLVALVVSASWTRRPMPMSQFLAAGSHPTFMRPPCGLQLVSTLSFHTRPRVASGVGRHETRRAAAMARSCLLEGKY
jgi:hypothetical protein